MDKSLRDYLLKKICHISPYGGYCWDSSAQKLSNELKDKGIKFDKKLFWKYKLPNGMSHQQFMDTLLLEYYLVKYGSKIKIISDKNLTIKQKLQVIGFVWKIKKNGLYKNIKKYADEIKRLNSELADVSAMGVYDNISFVEGALFGFAPTEIKYFCDAKRDLDTEYKLGKKLQRLGISTSYILAPETAKSLIVCARKQKGL